MKKAKTIFSSALLLLSAAALLAACNSNKVETSSSPSLDDSKTSNSSKVDDSKGSSKEEHVHTFSNEWSHDENKHWHAATCEHVDEKKDYADHSFDEGKVTKGATFEEEGKKTFTCTVCSMTKDEAIPVLNGFYMPIKTVSSAAGNTIITGAVASGKVKVNDVLMVSGANKQATIAGLSLNGKTITEAHAGDAISVKLTGIAKDEVKIGSCLYTPKFMEEVNELKVDLSVLGPAEGGAGTAITNKMMPNIYLYEDGDTNTFITNVQGSIYLPKDVTSIGVDETKEATIYLKTPFALRKGMSLEVRMNGKKLAKGIIKETAHHTHEAMYDLLGKCGECSIDQYLYFTYDRETNTFEFKKDLVEGETFFLKITPVGNEEDTTWDIVVFGADYNTDFEISKIHTDGTPLKESESIETGVTYIIKVDALKSKTGVFFVVMDESEMV